MIWQLFFQPFIEYGFMRRALVVCLALSVSTTILRVKYALWAPPILSSILSCPATGITFMSVITGLDCVVMMIVLPQVSVQYA